MDCAQPWKNNSLAFEVSSLAASKASGQPITPANDLQSSDGTDLKGVLLPIPVAVERRVGSRSGSMEYEIVMLNLR